MFDSASTTAIETPSSPPQRAAWSTIAPEKVPLHERVLPPTMEELEEMDLGRHMGEWDDSGKACLTPAGSMTSTRSRTSSVSQTKQVSRQVSRVSGLGIPGIHHMNSDEKGPVRPGTALGSRKPSRSPTRSPMQLPAHSPPLRRLELQTMTPSAGIDRSSRKPREEPGPRHRPNPQTRLSPVDLTKPSTQEPEPQHRLQDGTYAPAAVGGSARGTSNEGRKVGVRRGPPLTQTGNNSQQRLRRNVPPAYGTPSSTQDRSKKPEHTAATAGGVDSDYNNQLIRRVGSGDINPGRREGNINGHARKPLRRRSISAPDLSGADFAEFIEVAEEDEEIATAKDGEGQGINGEPAETKSPNGSSPSQAVWGGGLPPKRSMIAQGPAAARVVAARAPVSSGRFQQHSGTRRPSTGRYPSTDKESFARTLNEEELDEVWRGLGEGVSQRGAGSDVGFDIADGPSSPNGTVVSGAFPKLTANVLQRFELLAGGPGVEMKDGGSGPVNVMPLPKGVNDEKMLRDMEAGTRSSKKSSSGSSGSQPVSLLATLVSYGVLVLWMAHLVFNVLMLWPIVPDTPLWGLCVVPGLFGMLLSVGTVRRGHRCKPENAPVDNERRRTGPHPCSLPAYMLLVVSVVVALGMHTSALLYCEKDMQLFLNEATAEPLCDEPSLLLAVVFDVIILSVAGLNASGQCWSWVLS